ncbi:MAG: hypothetical protein F4233_12045 [Rhodospirillaceae bacterium]|nr:hypothetical protein [Rhodospirillaceae bacterium]
MSKLALQLLAAGLAGLLLGCAKTSVVPLSANEVRIVVDADDECGATGAQEVALERAAIEVLRRGYDRFVVVSVDGRSTATSIFGAYGLFGVASTHHNAARIQMFRNGEGGFEKAIDARKILGNEWQKKIKEETSTMAC